MLRPPTLQDSSRDQDIRPTTTMTTRYIMGAASLLGSQDGAASARVGSRIGHITADTALAAS